MTRFVHLAAESGVTAVDGMVDIAGTTPSRAPVPVRTGKVNGLLGTALSTAEMQALLEPIGFSCTGDGETFDVVVPTWRWDTTTETDVAEEVGRMFGYENIARTVPKGEGAGGDAAAVFLAAAVRELSVLPKRLGPDALRTAAAAIHAAVADGGRVHVTGVGKPEHLSRYVAGNVDDVPEPLGGHLEPFSFNRHDDPSCFKNFFLDSLNTWWGICMALVMRRTSSFSAWEISPSAAAMAS